MFVACIRYTYILIHYTYLLDKRTPYSFEITLNVHRLSPFLSHNLIFALSVLLSHAYEAGKLRTQPSSNLWRGNFVYPYMRRKFRYFFSFLLLLTDAVATALITEHNFAYATAISITERFYFWLISLLFLFICSSFGLKISCSRAHGTPKGQREKRSLQTNKIKTRNKFKLNDNKNNNKSEKNGGNTY